MFNSLTFPGVNMNPNDFEFTRSWVKGTRVSFVVNFVKLFPIDILKNI